MPGCTGYQGFQPCWFTRPPSLKPGETLESIASKYATESHGVVYRTDIAIETNHMKPLSLDAFGNVDLKDYKVPNRRGVMAAREVVNPLSRSKPFIHQSVFTSSFTDFKEQVAALQPISADRYRDAFNRIAVVDNDDTAYITTTTNTATTTSATTTTSTTSSNKNNNNDDAERGDVEDILQNPQSNGDGGGGDGGSGGQREPVLYISYRQVQHVLRAVHGKQNIPQWVIGKCVKYFERSKDGHVTWNEFAAAIERLRADVIADVSSSSPGKQQVPGWVADKTKMAFKPRAVAAGGEQMMISTYTSDFGNYGSRPADRPFLYKRGLLSSSPDLMYGTTKDTYHVPGYSGFIPQAKTNAQAIEHGDGIYTRVKETNMKMNYSHNVPGYTGHQPRSTTTAECREMRCGCSALTSSGAAALGLII